MFRRNAIALAVAVAGLFGAAFMGGVASPGSEHRVISGPPAPGPSTLRRKKDKHPSGDSGGWCAVRRKNWKHGRRALKHYRVKPKKAERARLAKAKARR